MLHSWSCQISSFQLATIDKNRFPFPVNYRLHILQKTHTQNQRHTSWQDMEYTEITNVTKPNINNYNALGLKNAAIGKLNSMLHTVFKSQSQSRH